MSIPGPKAGLTGHLVRIGSTGEIEDLGAIRGDPFVSANGANNGAFDGWGHFWVTSHGNPFVDEVSIGTSPGVTKPVRVSPRNDWQAVDFTFDGGYVWAMTATGRSVLLEWLDLSSGHVSSSRAPSGIDAGSSFGAAWTYGNGNLGFDDNGNGELYQVSVADPTSSSPKFSFVSTYSGPVAANNDDGAACVPTPVDLSIVASASVPVGASSLLNVTLNVTNHGKGISSGYVIDDSFPTVVTRLTSSSPGCKVSGHTVTCSEGELVVGKSASY